jgi:uncharacterized protein (TIGR03437 family)
MAGVDQINIVIPSGSPTGSVPLSLLVNGVFSPPDFDGFAGPLYGGFMG